MMNMRSAHIFKTTQSKEQRIDLFNDRKKKKMKREQTIG